MYVTGITWLFRFSFTNIHVTCFLPIKSSVVHCFLSLLFMYYWLFTLLCLVQPLTSAFMSMLQMLPYILFKRTLITQLSSKLILKKKTFLKISSHFFVVNMLPAVWHFCYDMDVCSAFSSILLLKFSVFFCCLAFSFTI